MSPLQHAASGGSMRPRCSGKPCQCPGVPHGTVKTPWQRSTAQIFVTAACLLIVEEAVKGHAVLQDGTWGRTPGALFFLHMTEPQWTICQHVSVEVSATWIAVLVPNIKPTGWGNEDETSGPRYRMPVFLGIGGQRMPCCIPCTGALR